MAKRAELQIQYPVAMTRKVTLLHNLTQVHFQRFYEQASSRMASVQGLRVNEDTDEEIARVEEVFTTVLNNAKEQLKKESDAWQKRLEDTGVDPDLDSIQGGVTFNAPVTTPWSNTYLQIYQLCDRALMLIEMAWISGEVNSVLDKRNAVEEVRKPLIDTARQVQRAVTQAFQEAKEKTRKREARKRVPRSWGEAGVLIVDKAPDIIDVLRDCTAEDGALFDKMISGIKEQYSDKEIQGAIDQVADIIINGGQAESEPDNETPENDKKSPARKGKAADEVTAGIDDESVS